MTAEAQRIIDDLVEKTGIRLTPQREKILQLIIENNNKHLTVDDIYILARENGSSIGIATIYRTIDLLEEVGAIVKRDFGGDSAKYEFVFKDKDEHHHLICKKCGKVIEVSGLLSDDIEERLLKEKGFRCVEHCLKIYGYCSECREKYNL
jgi:Fur family transcriptional regulator, ferric uptake regulator